MNFPLFIARRISLRTGGKRQAPAVTVAIISVALSVGIMIAAISIVLGFKEEIRDKVIGFNNHLTLYASPTEIEQENLLTLTPSLKNELNSLKFITDYSLQVAAPAILKTDSDFKGVYLKGLNGKNEVEFINKNIIEGSIPDYSSEKNKDKIIISESAARQLQLKCGEKIDVYFITDDVRVRRLQITGIYNSHFDQYDDVLIFGPLSLVQHLGGIGDNQGTYLSIMTDNFDKIPDYAFQLQNHLNRALAEGNLTRLYHTDSVLNQGIGYFSWLSLLDTNVVVILCLMMIVGGITLVSGMLIIILERKKMIGLLKALGASTSKVRSIFIFLSIKIAVLGMIIGNIVILSLLFIQNKTHFISLDPESYYIDYVPVNFSVQSILLLNAGVLFVAYCVLILPSKFVAKISPAETMRFE